MLQRLRVAHQNKAKMKKVTSAAKGQGFGFALAHALSMFRRKATVPIAMLHILTTEDDQAGLEFLHIGRAIARAQTYHASSASRF
jgi:hypothetical protein